MMKLTDFTSKKSLYWGLSLVVLILLGLAMATPKEDGATGVGYWYSLAPPLLAILLAVVSKRLIFSLFIGVISGGLLAVIPAEGLGSIGPALIAGPSYIVKSVVNPSSLRILFFISCVLMMISLVMVSGGFQAVVLWLKPFAKGPYSSKLITALMGVVLFMDDYANTLIIGNAMRPVTDQHKISREKLAFLVDSTSAPIAGLAFISSWIGYEVGLFSELSQSLGIDKNGYAIFLDALGFRFYCLLLLGFVILHIVLKRDYGPMLTAEIRARSTGALQAEDSKPLHQLSFESQEPDPEASINAFTAILPILTLAGTLFSLLFITGGGPALLAEGRSIFSLNTWQLIVTAIPNATILLVIAGLAGLIMASVLTRFLAKLSFKTIGHALLAGLKTSILPLSILIMAWSLKHSVDALHTGEYIVSIAESVIQPMFFPLLIFMVSAVTALTIGTSFGTMGIILPVAIPLAYQLDGSHYGLITVMSMAAVLDGAIFGDHCSPLSDTTIMSSISSGCDHNHHVKTQLPYAVTVGSISALCCYLPVAMGMMNNGFALLVGLAVITLVLLTLGKSVR